MAKRKRKKSRRKTYRKKRTAQKAAKGKEIYKVIGGWRISRGRKVRGKKGRKLRRKRRRKKRSNPGGWPCE